MKTITQSERLFLRTITLRDANHLLKLFSDPVAMAYFPSVLDLAGTMKWIKIVRKHYQDNGIGFYICQKKDTSEVIGYCGLLLQKNVGGKDEIEIGYGLIRSYWHQGFAAEAAKSCMEYGHERLGINRFISLIRPQNSASIKVAVRNGMK